MREKRRKFITAILMAVVMVLGGFIPSIRANAEPVGYGIWVDGTELTDANPSLNCGEGTAAYDDSTKTLTLTNATITGAYQDTSGSAEFKGFSQV